MAGIVRVIRKKYKAAGIIIKLMGIICRISAITPVIRWGKKNNGRVRSALRKNFGFSLNLITANISKKLNKIIG